MKIKVCGITTPQQLQSLQSHFAGLIFYDKSPRCVPLSNSQLFHGVSGPLRIGVFVDEYYETIKEYIKAFNLWGVQLHGSESPSFCHNFKTQAVVIKTIGIGESGFVQDPKEFEEDVDYFLFDYHGKERGGNGKKFNWELLRNIEKPFFLAGGIGPEDVELIKNLSLPNLYSLDLNSRFEISPGVKDLSLVNKFIEEVSK